MSGILAFLAGAGTGAMRGMQMREDRDAREEDRAWQREQRDRTRKQQGEEDGLRTSLRDAARPIAMTEGAGGMVRPDTMDNRDVGLPENQGQPNDGLMPMAYRVGSQQFADRGAAQVAVDQQNKPEAVNQRVVAAYRGAGQFDKAAQIESSDRQAEMQKMQLADAKWRRDLGTALQGGHAGLAKLATSSEGGILAGQKVQLIPSADGATVSYGVLGEDGKATPVPGLPAFSNDERGVTQAAFMLDKAITPEARMAHYQQQDDRKQKRDDRAVDVGFKEKELSIRERESNSRVELNAARAENMALRAAARSGSGGGGKGGSADEQGPNFNPLSDFDPKQARKGAMDQALKEAEASGKPVSEGEIAKRAQGIYGAMRDAAMADNTNRHVRDTVASAMRQAKDPAAYAATYAKAQQVASPEQLASWGFKAPAQAGGARPAAAPAAAAPAAQRAATAAPAQAAPPTPTDEAGARLDAARANLQAMRSRPAPGLAAGRAAIDQYAAQVQQARADLARAEAEYRRTVPQSGPAFVTPR
jgi:hypothetical protein